MNLRNEVRKLREALPPAAGPGDDLPDSARLLRVYETILRALDRQGVGHPEFRAAVGLLRHYRGCGRVGSHCEGVIQGQLLRLAGAKGTWAERVAGLLDDADDVLWHWRHAVQCDHWQGVLDLPPGFVPAGNLPPAAARWFCGLAARAVRGES